LPIAERISELIHERGPLTVAAFMELALYDPEYGYYARAVQRSGRAGDFFTSVDVGPLFGQLLAIQIAEMFALLATRPPPPGVQPTFDLVEAGAGNGRLSADILRAAKDRDPHLYESVRLHLVEASAPARAAQAGTLGDMGERLASTTPSLPESFEGTLVANELLDAMPVHQVVMRDEGLREVYVVSSRSAKPVLHLTEGLPSTPALQEYLDRAGVSLEPGWQAEISLQAIAWVRDAARRLRRGFMILIDYGHEARDLYSASHSAGTLTSYSRHRIGGDAGRAAEGMSSAAPWLVEPGKRDITAHVDFTSVRAAAQAEGLTTIALLDQTYFLMGLLDSLDEPQSAIRNPQFKSLIMPGGLGSTMKVLILGKDVGTPALKGTSFRVRVT
jgi:SAM-dependent MidA family methyltransferase